MTSKNVIKRWAVDISQWRPTVKEIAFACSCVQSEERERLMKFHFRDDFNASLIGRLLMRKFVNDLTGIAYDKIELNRDDRGKPILVNQLVDNQHIDFNVSHQGSFSVLAGLSQIYPSSIKTSSNSPNDDDDRTTIGVDVMKFEYTGGKPLNEFFRLMYRNFSDYEWKFIKSHSTEYDQLKAFMRNWTLKECYVKNIGIGITINLQKISFQLNKSELKLNSPATDVKLKLNNSFLENWIFEEHLINENHCAAVSIKNPSIDYELNKFEIITIDDLLRNAVSLQQPDELYASKAICKEYKKLNTYV